MSDNEFGRSVQECVLDPALYADIVIREAWTLSGPAQLDKLNEALSCLRDIIGTSVDWTEDPDGALSRLCPGHVPGQGEDMSTDSVQDMSTPVVPVSTGHVPRVSWDRDKARELLSTDMSDRDIAAAVGVSYKTIQRLRKA